MMLAEIIDCTMTMWATVSNIIYLITSRWIEIQNNRSQNMREHVNVSSVRRDGGSFLRSILLNQLSPNLQEEVLYALFHPTEGARFTSVKSQLQQQISCHQSGIRRLRYGHYPLEFFHSS